MINFLYTIVGLAAFESAGKLIWLARGEIPKRTLGNIAWEVAINVALMTWGIVLVTH